MLKENERKMIKKIEDEIDSEEKKEIQKFKDRIDLINLSNKLKLIGIDVKEDIKEFNIKETYPK